MEERSRKLLLAAAIFLLALAALLWFVGKVERNQQPVPANSSELVARHYRGAENGNVTIIEFGDFQCPYCGEEYPVMKRLLAEFPNLRLGYIHLPVPRIHEHAIPAALASECADEQGKFWEYHDVLFEKQNRLDNESLKQYAREIGLEGVAFDVCFDGEETMSLVQEDMGKAARLNVSATPTFFINGRRVDGAAPYDVLRQMIEAETRE